MGLDVSGWINMHSFDELGQLGKSLIKSHFYIFKTPILYLNSFILLTDTFGLDGNMCNYHHYYRSANIYNAAAFLQLNRLKLELTFYPIDQKQKVVVLYNSMNITLASFINSFFFFTFFFRLSES
jgi:hypothetical protein